MGHTGQGYFSLQVIAIELPPYDLGALVKMEAAFSTIAFIYHILQGIIPTPMQLIGGALVLLGIVYSEWRILRAGSPAGTSA